MVFNVWTFLFQVINFVALASILYWLLYRPLYQAIDRRRDANAKAQADAARARQEADALEKQLNTKLAALDQERQELMRKAREQAEADRRATLEQAERAAQKRREEAASQIERERAIARQALETELVQSAVSLAERLLQEASSSTLQEQLGARLVESLEHLPADERLRLRTELEAGDTALVETVAEVNGEILERLRAALESLAGRAVGLSVQARPELVGGLRLRLGGHVWDASLAGVLEEALAKSTESAPP